eukprot:gb/GECH01006862.1/.p1 GENE.gb/GECH01006862.1/~~gb/GECH01006862.1/.p1  ORF type:complete len:294 (+),score=8.93 gb/GECH01006862.1/:1-882(+)
MILPGEGTPKPSASAAEDAKLMLDKELEHDVLCSIDVSIKVGFAHSAVVVLLGSKVVFDVATLAAALSCVVLAADLDEATEFLCFVEDLLLELIVAPCEHLANRFAVNLSPCLPDHVASLKFRQKHKVISHADVLCDLVMEVSDKVLDPDFHPPKCSPHLVPCSMVQDKVAVLVLLVYPRLEIVSMKKQSHYPANVVVAILKYVAQIVIESGKGAYPRVNGSYFDLLSVRVFDGLCTTRAPVYLKRLWNDDEDPVCSIFHHAGVVGKRKILLAPNVPQPLKGLCVVVVPFSNV